MAMARWGCSSRSARLLYDVRGFFSDERVESGSWRRGSFVDRVVQRIETGNIRCGDGAVVLTEPAIQKLLGRRPSLPFYRVIPTCVDLSAFTPRAAEQKPEFGLVYSGSLGTWYMAKEMVAFARWMAEFVPEPTLFLTPQTKQARELGVSTEWAELRALDPDQVASWIRRARALFFFIRPVPSKRASCPTKLAEGLACGLPIVCNRGIGDLDEIVEKENVGVLVESFSEDSYRRAGQQLRRLLEDPETSTRCRRLAQTRYGLELGVEAYHQLYRELVAAGPCQSLN
jgi:glycosyltransferase involved in cell wall biosynthesis